MHIFATKKGNRKPLKINIQLTLSSKGDEIPVCKGGGRIRPKSILLSDSQKWRKIYENCYEASPNDSLNDKRKRNEKRLQGRV